MADVVVIQRNQLTPNLLKMEYSLTPTAASSSQEFTLPCDPFTLCSLVDMYALCASTTYTIALSDVVSGADSINELLKTSENNKTYKGNDLGIILDTSYYLYLTINNSDTVSTGVTTVSVRLRG